MKSLTKHFKNYNFIGADHAPAAIPNFAKFCYKTANRTSIPIQQEMIDYATPIREQVEIGIFYEISMKLGNFTQLS